MNFEMFKCNVVAHQGESCKMVCMNTNCEKMYICVRCMDTIGADHKHIASDLVSIEKYAEISMSSHSDAMRLQNDLEKYKKAIKEMRYKFELEAKRKITADRKHNELREDFQKFCDLFKADGKVKEPKKLEKNLPGGDIQKKAVVTPTQSRRPSSVRITNSAKKSKDDLDYSIRKKKDLAPTAEKKVNSTTEKKKIDLMDAPTVEKKGRAPEAGHSDKRKKDSMKAPAVEKKLKTMEVGLGEKKKRDLMDAPIVDKKGKVPEAGKAEERKKGLMEAPAAEKKLKTAEFGLMDRKKGPSDQRLDLVPEVKAAERPTTSTRSPGYVDKGLASVFGNYGELSMFIKAESPKCVANKPEVISKHTTKAK